MRFRFDRLLRLCFLAAACLLVCRSVDAAAIAGQVVAEKTGQPVEFATLELHRPPRGEVVQRTAADAHGRFRFDGLVVGDYDLDYAAVGTERQASAPIHLRTPTEEIDLGRLVIAAAEVTQLEKLDVSAHRAAAYNSIDRKVYNVGRDLQSSAGSASSLLQNVPSVEVDVDGNVSLRGNPNVLILIDGKSSALMSATNRGDALEQMPADRIERIEIVTNPSAKYKPDGTAGIINLVLKRDRQAGLSGSVRANVGNAERANTTVALNYNPGTYNLYGSASVRQEDRLRHSYETRQHTDATSGASIETRQTSSEHMRPLSRTAELGGDYDFTKDDKLHASASYNYLSFHRTSTVTNIAQTAGGPVTLDYDRFRTDPEWHKTLELDGRYQHSFAETGHELDLELKHEWHQELEDNHYENDYRAPVAPVEFDSTRMHPTEITTELSADYARPLVLGGKLETGFAAQADNYDTDFRAEVFAPLANAWVVDAMRTNRFVYHDWIDAAYVTYGRTIGAFGLLAGLRTERTLVHTEAVNLGLTSSTEYYRLHPSVHLTYNLTETDQLQLNYSHRVRRPESDDLNPFPEYQDPYNLRAGNPRLRPEETHSIEAGYQYHRDDTTYLATVYFWDTYHAFTTVTRYIDPVTLLTTYENLASNRSGGLELIANTPLGSQLNLNLSANGFYTQVDASDLGFTDRRSSLAWSAKVSAEWHVSKANLVQLNANYSAKRLTAQGYRMPNFYTNVGLRHEFPHRKLSLVITVSDLFNSLHDRTIIDTPALHDDFTRRRSSRTIYGGFIYTFGNSAKKTKGMEFDTSP